MNGEAERTGTITLDRSGQHLKVVKPPVPRKLLRASAFLRANGYPETGSFMEALGRGHEKSEV
jgi:hypothetical protein